MGLDSANLGIIQKISKNPYGRLRHEIMEQLNGSTLDEKTLIFLSNLIDTLSPSIILELGCGASTSVLADYIEKKKNTRLISVDNFQYFLDRATGEIDSKDYITSIFAPISLSFHKGCPIVTYSGKMAAVLREKSFKLDFVLVDGPYGRIFWRESAIVLLAPFLKKDALILMDDSNRKREQKSLFLLGKLFGLDIEIHELTGFNKGLTLIQLNGRHPKAYPILTIFLRYLELPKVCLNYLRYKKSLRQYVERQKGNKRDLQLT